MTDDFCLTAPPETVRAPSRREDTVISQRHQSAMRSLLGRACWESARQRCKTTASESVKVFVLKCSGHKGTEPWNHHACERSQTRQTTSWGASIRLKCPELTKLRRRQVEQRLPARGQETDCSWARGSLGGDGNGADVDYTDGCTTRNIPKAPHALNGWTVSYLIISQQNCFLKSRKKHTFQLTVLTVPCF